MKEKNITNIYAILSLIFAFLFFPLGLIFGIIALYQIKKTHEHGKGLAVAGVVISLIYLVAIVIFILILSVVIFTQQTGQFEQKVSEETKTELFKMRIFYGQCQPGESFENAFMSQYDIAGSSEERDSARSSFKDEVDRCKEFSDSKDSCKLSPGCVWK